MANLFETELDDEPVAVAPAAATSIAPADMEAEMTPFPVLGEESADWVPTPLQARFLVAAQQIGTGRKIQTICEEVGCSVRVYQKWMQLDERFRAAFLNIWRGSIQTMMPGVVAAMGERAMEGDTQAAKILVLMAGLITNKNESVVNINQSGTVNLQLAVQSLRKADEQLAAPPNTQVLPPGDGSQ